MDGKKLAIDINRRISEAGYKQEILAIGPSGIPVPIQALLPIGFRAFINLVPNEQLNGNGPVHQKQSASNGADSGPD